jgi:short-subunit dehydrogenase
MIVLITGVTGTLGTELFNQLLISKKVSRFILLGRNKNKLLNLQNISISNKIPCEILEIDFNNIALITFLLNKLNYQPDYLYLVHGYLNQSTNTDVDELIKHFNINFFSVVSIITYYLEIKKDVKVITTSSLASKVPSPTMSSYAASKSALNSFLDSKRLEIPEVNFKVLNCILGLIEETNMTQDIEKFKGVKSYDKAEVVKKMLKYSIVEFKNETLSIGNFVKVTEILSNLSPTMMNVISKWSMPEL